MGKIIPQITTGIKEIAMFAKDMPWIEIVKVAAFVNLCLLPSIIAVAWGLN